MEERKFGSRGEAERGWEDGHVHYLCADGTVLSFVGDFRPQAPADFDVEC